MKAVALDHRYAPATRLPMIELLLNKGADINAKDKGGRTPLLHSVVQYMSEAGGIISHPGSETAAGTRRRYKCHRRARCQRVNNDRRCLARIDRDCATAFVEGINVNVQNKKGTTALMIAAEKESRKL
jgi:ankyrin repeat protein